MLFLTTIDFFLKKYYGIEASFIDSYFFLTYLLTQYQSPLLWPVVTFSEEKAVWFEMHAMWLYTIQVFCWPRCSITIAYLRSLGKSSPRKVGAGKGVTP